MLHFFEQMGGIAVAGLTGQQTQQDRPGGFDPAVLQVQGRQGDLNAAARLCDETGRRVQAVVTARAHEAPGTAPRRQQIERLYGDLCLALTAQRAETSAALNALRRGMRVLNAYSRTGRFRR